MPVSRSARRILFAVALAATATPLPAQTASWIAPVSGTWETASNWSTGSVPGAGATAVIDATGAPYTVTSTNGIFASTLDLGSPDATLDIRQTLGATTAYLDAGTAFFRGTLMGNTVLRGTLPLTVDTTSATISNVTVATTLRGLPHTGASYTYRYIDFQNALTLDGGTLSMGTNLCPKWMENVTVNGTGTITSDSGSFSYLAGNAPNLTLGPGITLETTPGGSSISIDMVATVTNQPILYNNGTIASNVPGLSVSIGGGTTKYSGTSATMLAVVNGGTLAASNGGTLRVVLPAGGTPGNVALGAGGTISFVGPDYTLDRALTVGATSALKLAGGWKTGATITIDAGTLNVASNPSASCSFQYVNSPTVVLTNTLSAAALPLLNTTDSTRIAPLAAIDLGAASFSFASVPGQWSFPPAYGAVTQGAAESSFVHATIKNGILTAGPAGNDLLPGGGGVNLSAVTLNFPLTLDDGVIFATSNTTFAQGVSVSGTGRLMLSTFSNPGGIAATGGIVEFMSLPASPGPVSLSGTATLELDYSTTLSAAQSLPYGTPAALVVGPRGTLDAQGATVDLSTLGHDLGLSGDTGTATLANATVIDPSHARPLRAFPGIPGASAYGDRLSNVTCSADIVIDPASTLTLFQSTLLNSHVSGGGTIDHAPATTANPATFDNVTLDGTLHEHSNTPLTVHNQLTITGALTIDGTSVVDLTTGQLVLKYSAVSLADTVRTYLSAGRLTSSSADSTHRLGYLDDASAVTVRLTLAGDANLDGVVNQDDYALLDRGRATGGTHWWNGDFNYDGVVNQADYLLIDTSYVATHGASAGLLAAREAEFGPAYVADLLAAVPEPSSALAVASALLLAIRPRRRSAPAPASSRRDNPVCSA